MLLTSGSDIVIELVLKFLLDLILSYYYFSNIWNGNVYAKIYLTKQKKILFDENLNIKIEKIIKKINSRTSLVVIANQILQPVQFLIKMIW